MAGASKRRRSYDGRSRKLMRTAPVPRGLGPSKVPEIRTWLCSYTQLLTFSTPPILAEVWQQIRPRLLNLPNTRLQELVAVFDLYRINKFRVRLIPRFTGYDAGSAIDNPVPTFTVNTDNYHIINSTGGYDFTTYNRFLEFCTAPSYVMGDKIMTFNSKRAMALTATSELKPFPWTTCTNPNVFAYGLDFYIHCPNFANFKATTQYDLVLEMDVSFKGNR